jgi:hypothetical protein
MGISYLIIPACWTGGSTVARWLIAALGNGD